MEQIRGVYEEIQVPGKNLVDKAGQSIHAGNVRRIIVKDDKGNTFMEIPPTVGATAAPALGSSAAVCRTMAQNTCRVRCSYAAPIGVTWSR